MVADRVRNVAGKILFGGEGLGDESSSIHLQEIGIHIQSIAIRNRAIAADIEEIGICRTETAADSREIGIYSQEIATYSREIAADSQEMAVNSEETAFYRPAKPPQPWKRLPAAGFSKATSMKSMLYADSLQK